MWSEWTLMTFGQVTIVAGFLWFVVCVQAAEDPAQGDIRDIRVGSHVSELPVEGFVRRRCASAYRDDGLALDLWTQFERCPMGSDGLHEVVFEFDESKAQWAAVNDKWEGTKVSGHPVRLSLLFDEEGVAKALHINTDPSARAYLRKKAFLLRLRVLGRYGREGWACAAPTDAGELSAVGGVLINERCVKQYANRELTMTTKLYRTADQTITDYTNSTRLEILWMGDG